MNATVRDVMTASVVAGRGDTPFKDMAALLGSLGREIVAALSHVQGVVTVRDRLEYAGDRSRLPASS